MLKIYKNQKVDDFDFSNKESVILSNKTDSFYLKFKTKISTNADDNSLIGSIVYPACQITFSNDNNESEIVVNYPRLLPVPDDPDQWYLQEDPLDKNSDKHITETEKINITKFLDFDGLNRISLKTQVFAGVMPNKIKFKSFAQLTIYHNSSKIFNEKYKIDDLQGTRYINDIIHFIINTK